jgi:hypothetical protein
MVNLFISPGKDNFKYVELKQYEYYFSNLTYAENVKSSRASSPLISPFKSSYHKPIETKVYSLTVGRPDHDVMVIEISSCYGSYKLNIKDELITKDNKSEGSVEFTQTNVNGKNTIYIENLKSKHYYLTVKPKGTLFFCRLNRISEENCGNDLIYLIYYYTTYSNNLQYNDTDKFITHSRISRGKVKLDLPLAITKDIEANKKFISDYKFDVYATKKKDYTSYMENICRLSRLVPDKDRIFKLSSLTVENKNSLIVSDLEPGQTYYLNILVQNLKTKELLTFHPFEVQTWGRHPRFWKRLLRNLIIIGLIILLCFFIYKYRKAREELIFLKGEAVARTEREFAGMNTGGYDSYGIKYSTLGSGY